MGRNVSENWQKVHNSNRATHKEEDGFQCRFIDDVAVVKERAILSMGFCVEVGLEGMQPSVGAVVVEIS